MSASDETRGEALAATGGRGRADARAEIEAALPHREPFLLVDEVADRGAGRIHTRWRVPEDDGWVRGHYPGNPVLPGVLLCEHVFQSAALLVSHDMGGFREEDGVPVLTRIDAARFRRVVRPGEVLDSFVKVEERVGPAWFLSGRTMRGEGVCLKTRFVLSATGAMKRVLQGGPRP